MTVVLFPGVNDLLFVICVGATVALYLLDNTG